MAEEKQTTETTERKSIVPEKYGKDYKGAQDWVSDLIGKCTTEIKTVKRKVTTKNEDGSETVEEISEEKPGGVNVDALFELASTNFIDVKKYETQRETHGFPGRFRMTLANMLRSRAKQRHGLFDTDANWHAAPPEWLSEKSAPEKPTHTPQGEKIVPPKADAADKGGEADAA